MFLIKILVFAIVFSNICFSQNDEDIEIFNILLQYNRQNNFVIVSESNSYFKGTSSFIERIKNKRSLYSDCPVDTFRLSRKQKKYIINEIEKNENYKFSASLFQNNQIIISKDTLLSYSNNQAIKWLKDYSEIVKTKDSDKINQFYKTRGDSYKGSSWINFFSKPIYIQNKNICFVYYGQFANIHDDIGGCDFIQVLIKKNNKWQKFYQIGIECF